MRNLSFVGAGIAVMVATLAWGVGVPAISDSQTEDPERRWSHELADVGFPVDLKGRPLRWLGLAETGESVAFLTTLYEANDALRLREDLVETIGLHDSPAALAFLEKTIVSQAPDRIPAVVKIARSDRDRRLREEALEALADCDDPRAHQALRMTAEQ